MTSALSGSRHCPRSRRVNKRRGPRSTAGPRRATRAALLTSWQMRSFLLILAVLAATILEAPGARAQTQPTAVAPQIRLWATSSGADDNLTVIVRVATGVPRI